MSTCRAPDLGLFARVDGRGLHLRSRHHLHGGRRRTAAQRRRRGGADGAGRAMGRPADQARDRIHHQEPDRALARAGRGEAGGRRSRAGLSHRQGRLFRLQRGLVAPFRRVGADVVDHPVHRARAGALRRQDRDQRAGGEVRRRRDEAAHIDAGVATAFRHQPQAVRVGDLLFMSPSWPPTATGS